MARQIDDIRATADRVAASHGLEIVDVELTGGTKFRTLRVFIEKNAEGRAALAEQIAAGAIEDMPKGVPIERLSGVTHEDCAEFARDFGTVLDVEELVPGAEYTLEVSSPGIERKLVQAADYQRFLGALAKIQTFTAIGEPGRAYRQFTGRMKAFDGKTLTLDLSAGKKPAKKKSALVEEVLEVQIPLPEIEKANLVAELA